MASLLQGFSFMASAMNIDHMTFKSACQFSKSLYELKLVGVCIIRFYLRYLKHFIECKHSFEL